MKRTLTIEYGEEVLLALGISPEQFNEEVPLIAAIKLYELGRLSTGAAAAFAGVPKPTFLARLAEYGVDTFDLPDDEIQQDVNYARRHL